MGKRHAEQDPRNGSSRAVLAVADLAYGAVRRAQHWFAAATGHEPSARWVAAGAVLLLLGLPLLLGVSGPGPEPAKVAEQDSTLGRPWWETAGPDGASEPSPPATERPSDTYVVVGPVVEPPSPTTSSPTRRSPAASPTSAAPAPAAAPRRPTGPVVTALVGERCDTHDETRGYKRVGAHDDGMRSFYLRRDGGWDGNGCDGSFFAVPMSGDDDRADQDIYNVWWLKTGALRQGVCSIHIYIPRAQEPEDVSGRPAYYNVVAGKDDYSRFGGFAIDQVAAQGNWVNAGSYALRNGEIAVQMINRGDVHDGHVAAAQAAFTCRPA